MNNKSIALQNLSKDYGNGAVIENLNAHIDANSFTVILGPSGCGKSTLMNMIAGLETVTSGKILIGDDEVQDKEPKERGLAMVFQNYALYPHMTVADNIGYAMKIAKVNKAERMARIEEVAKVVELSHLLDRRPSQLSGGQQQRVAIARAIVRKPKVILYDEPLSNLDAKLRHEMRVELTRLHKEINATSVFVTHDQVEAMTLADKIMILNKGNIEQYDTPEAIYDTPASVFVAKFIGTPPMNVMESAQVSALAGTSDTDILCGIRPEKLKFVAKATSKSITGTVVFIENMGASVVVNVSLGDTTINAIVHEGFVPAVGDTVHLTCATGDVHKFCAKTEKRI